MEASPAPEETKRDELTQSIMPLLLVAARRFRFLVGTPLVCAIIAIVYCKLSDPIYTATARLLPPQYNENTVMAMQNQLGGESQLGNSALALKNPTDLFVGILTSRTIVDAVIERQQLLEYYGVAQIADARRKLSGATVIRAAKNGIVSVSVEDTDRQIAADLSNAYVAEFYKFSQDLARQQASRRADFYATALDAARQNLANADLRLLTTNKETGYAGIAGQDQTIVLGAAEIQSRIATREIQLRTMASYATDTNQDVVLIRKELKELRAELDRLTKISNGVEADGNAMVNLGSVPDTLLAFSQRSRDVRYWENIVELIGQLSELGKIDERRDLSLFQVLDHAIAPHDKSKPRTALAAILTFIGVGIVCLFWVLVQAYVSQRKTQSSLFDEQWAELKSLLMFGNPKQSGAS
ncbi:MAG: Wzz/FepE/Etk N-terminal domain-containing protein [Pseudomonadota bacterium]